MARKLSYRHRLICAIPYSLLHFLIAYGCLKQYLDNCCKEPSLTFIKDVERGEFLLPHNIGHLFTWAFVWHETPEGYDYWYNRRRWYLEYLETNKL